MKVVLNDVKTGKSFQKEFENDLFIGRKIGEKLEGNLLGLSEYEFQITGGSDNAGFPHRKDVEGSVRKKILASKSTGVKKVRKGEMIRKSVMGNTFSTNTAQVNLKVVKYGKKALAEVLGIVEKPKEAKAEKPEKAVPEKPKEERPKAEKAVGKAKEAVRPKEEASKEEKLKEAKPAKKSVKEEKAEKTKG